MGRKRFPEQERVRSTCHPRQAVIDRLGGRTGARLCLALEITASLLAQQEDRWEELSMIERGLLVDLLVDEQDNYDPLDYWNLHRHLAAVLQTRGQPDLAAKVRAWSPLEAWAVAMRRLRT